MRKRIPEGALRPELMGKEDKPKPDDPTVNSVIDWRERENLKLKQAKVAHGNEVEKEKLRISKLILVACGCLLLLFYIAEIIIASTSITIEPQIRMLFIEPVRFVLTATVGYLFATRGNSER